MVEVHFRSSMHLNGAVFIELSSRRNLPFRRRRRNKVCWVVEHSLQSSFILKVGGGGGSRFFPNGGTKLHAFTSLHHRGPTLQYWLQFISTTTDVFHHSLHFDRSSRTVTWLHWDIAAPLWWSLDCVRVAVLTTMTVGSRFRFPIVIGFFEWPNPSSRTMTLGSTQPLTEMSIRNLPGGKERKADNLTAICEQNI
jgi:hypothetical protein